MPEDSIRQREMQKVAQTRSDVRNQEKQTNKTKLGEQGEREMNPRQEMQAISVLCKRPCSKNCVWHCGAAIPVDLTLEQG